MVRPENPDVHYLHNMIINLRVRQKYLDAGHPVDSYAIGIQQELYVAEIDYQGIHIDDHHNETIQILCNDPEEREHIIHLLLTDQHILCIENGDKRYFSKFVDENEKMDYRWIRRQELKDMEEKGNLNKKHHEEVIKKMNETQAAEREAAKAAIKDDL